MEETRNERVRRWQDQAMQIVYARDHEESDMDGRGFTVLTTPETWANGGGPTPERPELMASYRPNPEWEKVLSELDHRFFYHTWSGIRQYIRRKGFEVVTDGRDKDGRTLLMKHANGLLVGMVENKVLGATVLFAYGVQDIGEDGTTREVSPFGLRESEFHYDFGMFSLGSQPLVTTNYWAKKDGLSWDKWDEVMTPAHKCALFHLDMRSEQSDIHAEQVSPDGPDEGFVRAERVYYAWHR